MEVEVSVMMKWISHILPVESLSSVCFMCDCTVRSQTRREMRDYKKALREIYRSRRSGVKYDLLELLLLILLLQWIYLSSYVPGDLTVLKMILLKKRTYYAQRQVTRHKESNLTELRESSLSNTESCSFVLFQMWPCHQIWPVHQVPLCWTSEGRTSWKKPRARAAAQRQPFTCIKRCCTFMRSCR